MIKELSYRKVEKNDFETICRFPQNPEELFFMFPKAEQQRYLLFRFRECMDSVLSSRY